MTSDEPAIAVSAPATSPPVQDSAVASRQLRARHASSTDCARVRVSTSNTECSASYQRDEKHENSVNRGQQIIEHDAEPAMDATVGPPYRPWLPDIEEPEEQESGGVGQRVERRGQQHQPLRCDLVDHDRAGVCRGA